MAAAEGGSLVGKNAGKILVCPLCQQSSRHKRTMPEKSKAKEDAGSFDELIAQWKRGVYLGANGERPQPGEMYPGQSGERHIEAYSGQADRGRSS